LAGTGVFGKQSPGPGHCGPLALPGQARSRYRGAPSPEVTGPSCRVPWRGFSRPPWSSRPAHLCRFAVRAPTCSLAAFLGGSGSVRTCAGRSLCLTLAPRSSPRRTYLPGLPTGLEGHVMAPGPTPPRPRITGNARRRGRNLNRLSVACASRPRLRPASPAADQPGCGTLGHPVGQIRTALALLVPTFALPPAPGRLPPSLLRRMGRSPTMPRVEPATSTASAPGLSPGGLSAPRHPRPVSYYALFQGWLLLSQPPGCRRAVTALPT
jgi:hypothetical protein